MPFTTFDTVAIKTPDDFSGLAKHHNYCASAQRFVFAAISTGGKILAVGVR
jgi:hypothetical protein